MLPGGHLLSVLIFFPAVGALALLMLRGAARRRSQIHPDHRADRFLG